LRSSKPSPFPLGETPVLEDLLEVAGGGRVVFGTAARKRVSGARKQLLAAAAKGAPIYGVNTGFGELASRRIPEGQLRDLQRNLVLSHACGVGEPLPPEEARGVLFLRTNELARGHSGARPELVETMAALLNAGAAPFIPCRGSVGASGDLAPQAHMALLLLGEGKAYLGGRLTTAREALKKAGVAPVVLEAKEGLSLLNGTQAMQSCGGHALAGALRIARAAQAAGAMSLEAMTGTPVPFDEAIHLLKPHPGQLACARELRELLEGSQIRESHRENDPRVQDPYSLRCMPQVHGAAFDLLSQARATLEVEFGSVTDNPIVSGGKVYSGGNFHGMALSFALDQSAMALTALAGISERRVSQLVSGLNPGLTAFLAQNPGLESGWMIAQVAAAALASECKTLAHPASSDSIPTSANKEDFVSMGMGAALKLKQVVFNAAQVVAVELLVAAEGVERHRPLKPGRGVARALEAVRSVAAPTNGDEILSGRMEAVRELVLTGNLS
jgi:histidine ammonia-lyase